MMDFRFLWRSSWFSFSGDRHLRWLHVKATKQVYDHCGLAGTAAIQRCCVEQAPSALRMRPHVLKASEADLKAEAWSSPGRCSFKDDRDAALGADDVVEPPVAVETGWSALR